MKWQYIILQELLQLKDPGVWGEENINEGISVIRSTNFKNDGTLDLSKLTFRDIPLAKRAEKKLIKNDILLERSGGSPSQPVGRVCFFNGDSVDHVFGNFITRLRANTNLCHAKYIFWYLYWFYVTGRTGQYQKQTTGIRNLEYKRYLNLEVPLPTLSEQHRVVEIIDQADALRRMQTEADAKAECILPALFIKTFGEPSTWTDVDTEPLGRLVNIQSGGTPSKKNPDYWDGDIPWVSPKDMKQDIIFDSSDHITQKAIEETNIKYVEPGAILIVVRGMILAHTIPIALAGTRLTINQDMKALQPNCNHIDSTYLHAALKASSRKILSQVGTAAHGTRKFDTDELLKLSILIPSQEKLKKFQQAVTDCRASLAGISKTKGKLEKLFEILLRRAFSGELTAKWREAHMTELLAEMEEQAKLLKLATDSNYKQIIL